MRPENTTDQHPPPDPGTGDELTNDLRFLLGLVIFAWLMITYWACIVGPLLHRAVT